MIMNKKIALLLCLCMMALMTSCDKSNSLAENTSMENVNERIKNVVDNASSDENLNQLLEEELETMVEEGVIKEYSIEDSGLIGISFPDGSISGFMTKDFDPDRN